MMSIIKNSDNENNNANNDNDSGIEVKLITIVGNGCNYDS